MKCLFKLFLFKKGLKKLSRLGSKNVSSKFDGKGHVSTTTRYNEDEEMVTLRKGDKEVKVPRSRVSHFIDRHYRIVEGSRPHLLYTLLEADKDGDGKGDLKGFDASTTYSLRALQAKYPHADNLMSALMSQSEETNKRQDEGDKKRDELDKLHNKNIDTIEQKLHDVIKKNNLTEEKEKSIVNEIDPSRSPWTTSGKHPGAMSQRELKREIAVFDEMRDRGDHLSPKELAQEDSLYGYLEKSSQRSIGEMQAEDMQKQANRIIEKAKWKKQRAEGIEDIAKAHTKKHTLLSRYVRDKRVNL